MLRSKDIFHFMIKKGRVLTYQWKLKWLPSHSKITFHNSSFSFFTTKAKQPLTKKEPNEIVLKAGQDRSKKDTLYLHVAPDGDHWISGELFAAKHLQPDYVKSILIPNEIEMNILKTIEDFENVDGFDVLMKDVYDTGDLSRLLERTMLFFYLYGVRSSPEDSFRDAQTLNQKVSFQQNAEHNIIKPSKVPKSNRTETEDFYLTMYRTIQKSQDICNQKITHTSSLLKDLHEYIHKSHPQIQNQCSSPPKISCAKSFSVVIVFYQTDEMGSMADHFDVNTNEDNPHLTLSSQRLRTLFLNILTLINIPNHSPDITVIYHGNIHDLREDRPYGDRIWNWSLKGHHRRIRLVYSTDHVTSSKDEDDIIDTEDITDTELLKDIYFPLHSSIVSKAKSDILLFLDGSKALTHGDTGGIDSIQAGFDLIRLHSHALVGNEDGIRRFENRNENWTDVKIGKESFRPICGEPQILVHHSRQVKEETIPRSGAVLSFHGLFFHRSYSCYIWDKPLDNFRDNMNSISMNHVHSSRNLGLLASSLSMFVPLSRANSEPVFVYPTLSQTYNNLLYTAPHRILQDMDMKDDRGKYDLHNVPTASRKRKKRLDSESTIPQIQTSTRDLQSILTSESVRRNLSIERKTRLTVHHNLEPNLQQNTIQNYQTHSFAVSEEMELKKVLQYFGGYFPVDFLLSETMKSKEDPLTWRHEQKSMCS